MADTTATTEYIAVVHLETVDTHKAIAPGGKIKLSAEQAKILLAKGAVKKA